ncbi:MAG: nucleotidyl transferase AbiEii/AbiGii toxin family protein [Endomicrobium sp.]|jgi:predicted nucleotidyltransferase component of viral defense system|nr:nucleotidyl transferase AbiEii/AbiGii toxin family protein [Endomicrobium sp.]
MPDKVFDQMMSRYEILTDADYNNALHEVMQEIALAGLYRGGFFEKAAFYGGTALRIFYKTDRFSEDLDFSLIKSDKKFKLEDYFSDIENEFTALGRSVSIKKKEKQKMSNIESAFLKNDTEIYDLKLNGQNTKIKIEVDTQHPGSFETEYKVMLLPFSFMARCFSLPDLFAGKIHAFLYRQWKTRVKGRDWYDFEWYIRNNAHLNFNNFISRAQQFSGNGYIPKNHNELKTALKGKILKTDIEAAKADVRPFIKNPDDLKIWSQDYFVQLVQMMEFL